MTILGLYRVTSQTQGTRYAILCSNIFPYDATRVPCDVVYDIKGSLVGRVAQGCRKVRRRLYVLIVHSLDSVPALRVSNHRKTHTLSVCYC